MGIFDFLTNPQEATEKLQKKAEEWVEKTNQTIVDAQDKLQQLSTDYLASLGYSEVPSPDNPEKSIMVYTCPVCGSHQEKNRKTTTHGVICAECANRLKDRWGLYTDGHGYTKEQFYALCDNFTSASEIFSTFIVPNPPIVLKPDEYCIYVGEACGGKIKIIL